MTASELPPIRLHEDPELFGESVDYTSATTGFVARLVEKDYFCSVVLLHLATLRLQLESELKPVLRPVDFEGFDLERAIDLVTTMAAAVG